MLTYQRLGSLPQKRHTQFRKPDGTLYVEEVFGAEGFSGKQSLMYHLYAPTEIVDLAPGPSFAPERWDDGSLSHRHLRTAQLQPGGDPIAGRRQLLFNDQVTIGVARPVEAMSYFFRNAHCDEMYYIQDGSGAVASQFGVLPYRTGDYVLIPRGTTYQVRLESAAQRWLVVEAHGAIDTPNRYRNDWGQILEHAPYSERDFRGPATLETHDERGAFRILVKYSGRSMWYTLGHHPFDVVGWDGMLYPVAFNIADFEPITKLVHAPPPAHQTFQGPGFVVCSFVPRKVDYHPEAVPAPYVHHNLDSNEVMFYLNTKYGARRGIEVGSMTLHPEGIPHGPQPGAVEASLGQERTEELAVMVDTFRPLFLTQQAAALLDPSYPLSWSQRPEGYSKKS
ncbi:MAG: homogentisate 1,2-dioxygenase [Chloroflexi bacterium]|nr:homogentisate 1,2-dioxygenase [Chloroflexota bacterium]